MNVVLCVAKLQLFVLIFGADSVTRVIMELLNDGPARSHSQGVK